MSKYYLVVNPHGGAGRGPAILEKVKPVFKEAGTTIDVKETRYAGHARIMINTLPFDGYDGFCPEPSYHRYDIPAHSPNPWDTQSHFPGESCPLIGV